MSDLGGLVEAFEERHAEEFRYWLAGVLVGSIRAIDDDDVELEIHTTGDGYLPSFTVRRGDAGLVVHIESEIG